MPYVNDFDFVVVGGGLQGCLLLQAIHRHQPGSRVLLVEKDDSLCGNHTWSFHRTDLSNNTYFWFKDLIDHSWDSYEVRLGQLRRQVQIPYGSVVSDSLAHKTEKLLNEASTFERLRGNVTELSAKRLSLDSGREIRATAVLDARGVDASVRAKGRYGGCGFQKFVGLEVELASDWTSQSPTLMDDSVDQSDGFRFIYALPFSPRRVLIEDTRFSSNPNFHTHACAEVIDQYLKTQGHDSYSVIRKESGCLPMPYVRQRSFSATAIGYRGGFFHPATGFSIPLAANLADRIASAAPTRAAEIIADFRKENRFQHTASLWLNRMLFQLIKPQHRSEIFRRFHRKLSTSSIEKFYAHRFTMSDILQMVIGRPPSGLTPIRFLKSFGEEPCPAI